MGLSDAVILLSRSAEDKYKVKEGHQNDDLLLLYTQLWLLYYEVLGIRAK